MTLLRTTLSALFISAFLSMSASAAATPLARVATTCDDYSNQADAQRGADTRDPDHDGVYCESLPCPCLKPGSGGGGGGNSGAKRRAAQRRAAAHRRAVARKRAAKKRAAKRRKAKRIRRLRKRIEAAPARIVAVTDGDTLKVHLGGSVHRTYRVRIIDEDTPESRKPGTPVECGAKEATSLAYFLGFTAATDSDGDGLLDTKGGKGVKVHLKTDRSQDLFDRYKRLLAYVDVPAGARGTGAGAYDFGNSMIAAGFAKTYVFNGKPAKRHKKNKAAAAQAKAAGKGVWSLCGGDFHSAD
jgi:endonuclease YncB( thermonuclease family)